MKDKLLLLILLLVVTPIYAGIIPHVMYEINDNSSSVIKTYKNATWIDQIIVNQSLDTAPSFAYANDNTSHISYTNKSLIYVKIDTDRTVSRNVVDPSTNGTVYDSYINVDSNSNPHILYRTFSGFRYAKKNGNSWNILPISNGDNGGGAIELDFSNNPHIVYIDGSNVKYAFLSNGAWVIESIEVGYSPRIALDSNNNPHVAYYTSTSFNNQTLRYAKRVSGVWIMSTVVDQLAIRDLSIDVDSSNNPHITYRNFGYVKYTKYDGVAWNTETAYYNAGDYAGPGSYYKTDLKLDRWDRPYIVFWGTMGDSVWGVRYTRKISNVWQRETIKADISTRRIYLGLMYSGTLEPEFDRYGNITNGTMEVFWNSTNPPTVKHFVEACTSQWSDCINSGWISPLSYTFTGLNSNTKYYLRAKAEESSIESEWSDFGSRYTLSNLPNSNSFGTVTTTSVQPQWTANSNPSGTQYLVQRCTSQWSGCIDSGWITSTSHSFTGLSPNTLYSFRVKSRNGDNVESGWTTLGNKATLANAPVNPSHDATDQTTARIKWTWQSGGGQKDYDASNSLGTSSWTVNDFWVQNGLSTNTQYTTTIKARNIEDVNTSSITHSAYTSIQGYTGIDFGNITTTSIQARPQGTFSNLAAGSSGTYVEQVSPALNSGWRQNNNYWNSTGLSINTQYCYRVNVRNGDGDGVGISSSQCKYTLANAPISSGFTSISSSSITANWNANSNPTSVQYLTERCLDSSFSEGCINSNWIQSTSYTFGSLTSNTTYHFRVRARNGDNSNTSITSLGNATTPANPPISPSFGTITTTSEEILWSDNNPDSTQYHIDHSTDGSAWSEVAYTVSNNFIHNNLISNTKHYYRIAAKNSLNQFTNYIQTNPTSKYTLANSPGALGLSSGGNSITASWTQNGNAEGTLYLVERCTSQWSTCVNSDWITQTSYAFTGLNSSTLYYFRVRAKNGDNIVTSWTDLGSLKIDGNAPTITLSYPSGIDPDVPRNFPIVFDVNDNGGVNNNTCYYNLTSIVNNIVSNNIQRSTSCPDGRKVVWITTGPFGDCKTYSTSLLRRTCIVDYTAADSIGNIGAVLQKSLSPVSGLIHLDNFEWCTKSICQISETPFSTSLVSGATGQQYSINYFTEKYNSAKVWRATQGSGSNIFQKAAKVGGRSSQDVGYEMPDGSISDLISEVRVDTAATFSFAYRVSTESGSDQFEFSILKTGGGSILNPSWEACRFPIIGGYQVSGQQSGEYQSLNSETDIANVHCKVLEPGTYRFRWRYAKNALNFAGDDSVQIDNFKIQEYQI